MAILSKLTADGIEYEVKDASARSQLTNKANLVSPAFTGTPTAPTASAGTNSTQLATTEFVMNAVGSGSEAMKFKGTIGSSGATVTSLPATHTAGWVYKVATAGTYAGQVCEIGDMIICTVSGISANDTHWAVVQNNLDGAVTGPSGSTADHVATFVGTSGKVIKDSGFTIGKSVPSNAVFTDTNTTYTITQDSNDRHKFTLTGSDGSSQTITIPDNNTWIAMVGATSSSNGGAGYVPTPPSDGWSIKYLRADGVWAVPPDYNTWRPVSDSVSSTSSSDAASSKAVKTAYDLANGKVSCTTANVKSALGTGSGTTKYLREDGTWVDPRPSFSYNSTTTKLTISY